MRNLVLTKTSETSIVDNYIRMVKKNKQLVSILYDDRENLTSSIDTFVKIAENSQAVGLIVNDLEITDNKGKLLLIETKLTSKELEDPSLVKDRIKETNDLTWVIIKVPENYNRLDTLISFDKYFKNTNIRFIGGNLFKLDGLKLGYIDDSYISNYKLKRKATLLYNETYCVMSKVADIFPVTKKEFDVLIEEEVKEKPKKISSTRPRKAKATKSKTKSTSPRESKTISKSNSKRSLKDIFNK